MVIYKNFSLTFEIDFKFRVYIIETAKADSRFCKMIMRVFVLQPESKQKSKRWIGPDENDPVKPNSILSAKGVLATVFWDSQRIILIDYLQDDITITGEYRAALLDRLNGKLKVVKVV